MEYTISDNPNDWIVEKLLKLQSILNVAHNKNGRHVPQKDRSWVMGQISALREGARLDRHQMKYANQLWEKYR